MVDFSEIPAPIPGKSTSAQAALYAAKFIAYALESDPKGERIEEMVELLPSMQGLHTGLSSIGGFAHILRDLTLAKMVQRHVDGTEKLTDEEYKMAMELMQRRVLNSLLRR